MTGIDEEQCFWMLHLQIWQQDDRRMAEEGEALAKTETDVEEILSALCPKISAVNSHHLVPSFKSL
jgi:hypothetical protein